jgi:AcrR family transcriptional regulator
MTAERAPDSSLSERKRRRAKEAIRQAALELFSERGFDAVSVTDIAERAEVGRTTFFRYFGDKQEVLFSDPAETGEAAFPATPVPTQRIGSSMDAALAAACRLVVDYIEDITADPAEYEQHQQLVKAHPELYARSLVKQRRLADELTDRLRSWGAAPATARQAAEVGLACFYAGQATAADNPTLLTRHVERAFDRLRGRGTDNAPAS